MYTLPSDRSTTWQPGVTYNGGIPSGSWPIHTTLSPSGGDDVTPIQNALDASHTAHPTGGVVKLNAGTYNFNSGYVTIPSNTVLRGSGTFFAGAGYTLLQCTNGATPDNASPGAHNAPLVIVGPARFTNFPPAGVNGSTSLTADGAKAATSITVASATGFSVGQMVLIDELSKASFQTDPEGMGQIFASADWRVVWQLHNPGLPATDDPLTAGDPIGGAASAWFCRQGRPTCEVKIISGISGTTITFTTPLHIDYRTANTAQMCRFEYTPTVNAGVEDLTGFFADDGTFNVQWAKNCWLRNVEAGKFLNPAISLATCFQCEVRDSYIHDAYNPYPGGAGYAISTAVGASEYLIENCISRMANKVMVARCAGAGAVVGYNYCDDGYIGSAPTWQEIGLNSSHMVGGHHTLFEGNWCFNYDSDKTHGNAVYMTAFRNHLTGTRTPYTSLHDNTLYSTDSAPRRCSGPAAFGYWHSIVGNVLGESGKMAGWVYTDTTNSVMTTGAKAIYSLGWDDWVSNYPSLVPDPNVASGSSRSVIRDGNYDYLNNAVNWHNSAPDTLPNSMYLSSKPAFFGALTWPWVDPVNGVTYTLPAKARFEGTSTPPDSSPNVSGRALTHDGFLVMIIRK